MNERDTKNLKYLLSIDDVTRQQWFNLASHGDRIYAMELFKRHNQNMDAHFLLHRDKVDDTMVESKEVLKRIMA
jgi:hypothetical protein